MSNKLCFNGIPLEEQVKLFKKFGNQEFEPIHKYYAKISDFWWKQAYQYTRIDRQTFRQEFDITLLKALRSFQVNTVKFSSYFYACCKKLIKSYQRRHMGRKSQTLGMKQKFSLPKHDLYDKCKTVEIVDTMDAINNLIASPNDRMLLLKRITGATINEVCQSLKINKHEYRKRIDRICSNQRLLTLFRNET